MGRHKKDCTCETCTKGMYDTAPASVEEGRVGSMSVVPKEMVPVEKASPAAPASAKDRELELMRAICAQCDELERRKILSFGPLFRMVRELRILKSGK